MNARGKYFNAQSAQELAESVVSLSPISRPASGTGTAVGLAGAQLNGDQELRLSDELRRGWWGDVKKYALDPNTGALPSTPAIRNTRRMVGCGQTRHQASGTGWNTTAGS